MPIRKVEEQLQTLNALRASSPNAQTEAALRKALSDRVNLVVAKAATVSLELELQSLVPDLLKAFYRLFEKPVSTDRQCWAKNGISKALKDLGYAESGPFILGLQHVQMEPVWGGQTDTAITLRGTCALALVNCTDLSRADKLRLLVRSLTDSETPVRIDAVRALEQMEGTEPALLLRLKATTREKEPSVTGQVLESLLRLEGEAGIPFVAAFLRPDHEEIREEAALALGISKLPGAVIVLIEAWDDPCNSDIREALLRGISASRQPSAIEFLLKILREGRGQDALGALEALQVHSGSEEIRRFIAEAVQGRTGSPFRNFSDASERIRVKK